MNFELEIQKAIVARLQSYTAINDAVEGKIYDKFPQDDNDEHYEDQFPYIMVGEDIYTALDTDGLQGVEGTISIHIWSIKDTFREVKTIHGMLRAALDRYALLVTGITVVDLMYAGSQSIKDSDAKTLHGISEFRILAYLNT